MKTLFTLLTLVSPLMAAAQFDIRVQRGSETLKFETPQRSQEMCVIPQHSKLGAYGEDDLKDEKELCSYDFHGLTKDREVQQMALCPKLNSTNPGVLAMEIPEGWERKKFEAEKCLGENELQKTQAKFKQSITCSYTPAILGYYHFSRYLDGAGRVPVAVLRTLTRERHKKIAELGYKGTREGTDIHRAWDSFENPKFRNLVYDATGELVFGALQVNTKNEATYTDIAGKGKGYDARYASFLTLEPYTQLKNPRNILDVLGSNRFEKIAASLTVLKDVSDMILLDTILSQQDRMYNQHYKWTWTWLENGEIKRKRVKTKLNEKNVLEFITKKEIAEKEEFEKKNAVLVKELILKDNDCGVRANYYGNNMKKVKALNGINHISGVTYTAFLRLAKSLKDPAMLSYLKNETLMTDADLKNIIINATEADSLLRAKCRSGQLKLDLDLDTHFSKNPKQFQCDI